jgi:hypothetical protein
MTHTKQSTLYLKPHRNTLKRQVFQNFRHSLKAIKMSQTEEQSLGAQEREAYRSQDYQDLCKAIGVAVEQKEALRWQLEAAKMRFEAWRTQQANDRQIERLTK